MLRLGTRRSRLALAQAREVADALRARGEEVEVVPIVTSGDRGVPSSASREGLKGLFVAEIVLALAQGSVDLAVHSAKDLPSGDPDGIVVAAVPERADPRDVLVTAEGRLGEDATVGTASLRRRAQMLRLHPEARIVELRGNVDTRLLLLAEGAVDALVLAAAGLDRLGARPPHVAPFEVERMVPAPGQGALAIQARANDERTLELVKILDHPPSRAAFEAERVVVERLGGGCALPLGAFASIMAGEVHLRAIVIRPDGSGLVEAEARAGTAYEAGVHVADALLSGGAAEILAAIGR